jgi:hypothetical protein
MKTRNIGFWTIAILAGSMLVAPAAYSQTENFSASLAGGMRYLQSIVPAQGPSK